MAKATSPKLPNAQTYHDEVKYMPWGQLVTLVVTNVLKNLGKKGEGKTVLDLMCGTGFLLSRLAELRPDAQYTGLDISKEYLRHARRINPRQAKFIQGDALSWTAEQQFDVVLCTGGLHHIKWQDQEILIAKMASLVKPTGFAIIADPYISAYRSEHERKLAAAQLGYEYLVATIKNGATDDVVKATADLIANDVAGLEYKTSLEKMDPIVRSYFSTAHLVKVWPSWKKRVTYGDYFYVCRR